MMIDDYNTVLRLVTEEGELHTVVGCIPCVAPGEHLTASGVWETHPQHGEQLKALELENSRLKKLLAEAMLDADALRVVARGKF